MICKSCKENKGMKNLLDHETGSQLILFYQSIFKIIICTHTYLLRLNGFKIRILMHFDEFRQDEFGIISLLLMSLTISVKMI